jgi:hypothetical protein
VSEGGLNEGIALQPGNPAHLSSARLGFAAAAIIAIVSTVVLSFVELGLPRIAVIFGVLIVSLGVGLVLAQTLDRWRSRRAVAASEAYRAEQEAETDRKIEEARKSGII